MVDKWPPSWWLIVWHEDTDGRWYEARPFYNEQAARDQMRGERRACALTRAVAATAVQAVEIDVA